MPKLKDIPNIKRPREIFMRKGPEGMSKTDLLAIVLGSGIKGKNVQTIANQIIKRFGDDFLNVSLNDLMIIDGIGKSKAMQIVSAINLVKRFYIEKYQNEIIIKSSRDVLSLTYNMKNYKKEHLVCLSLNSYNGLIKKETISIGSLDKCLVHPREVFYSAVELKAARIIMVHNHPSGNSSPSEADFKIVKKLSNAGELMGIPIIDFIIIGKNKTYSYFEKLNINNDDQYLSDVGQLSLFDYFNIEEPKYNVDIKKVTKAYYKQNSNSQKGRFLIQNRRYLGNKYKLLGFIEDIIHEKCQKVNSFCDIFAGTGVVGERFNNDNIKVISNDLLNSNYVCLNAFLGAKENIEKSIKQKIKYLNNINHITENYFSENFGGTYFSMENAMKIGSIRHEIDLISESKSEKNILLCSLLYAVDKIANTVGHYDAFRKKMDSVRPLNLLVPSIDYKNNNLNDIYNEDANTLIKKIFCDILYIDPPYNSRQYSDAYHLLENLSEWRKPKVKGIAKKMDRSHIKSSYCIKQATNAFESLIQNANCKHILLSYNNTAQKKDSRSNARICDNDIIRILKKKGEIEVFEKEYKAFTTGKSDIKGNTERIFYCKVTR